MCFRCPSYESRNRNYLRNGVIMRKISPIYASNYLIMGVFETLTKKGILNFAHLKFTQFVYLTIFFREELQQRFTITLP